MTTVHEDGTVWLDVTRPNGEHIEVPAIEPRRKCALAAVLLEMRANKPAAYQRLLEQMADDVIERVQRGELVTL